MPLPKPLATGLGGVIGSHFRADTNQLFFVEYGRGRISRLDLIRPAARVVSKGSTTLKGTFLFNLDTGVQGGPGGSGWDIWWRQRTTVKRQMEARESAEIALIGPTSFTGVTVAVLQSLPYSKNPIIGNNDASNQLKTGTVFAVRTTAGNYAKVQVVQYGYNMKIRWVTYRLRSGYRVLGTGYDRPEDIVLTEDGLYAYVTERGGKLLKVKLSSANRTSAKVVSSGMRAPHQISLDEVRGIAHVVEFAASGRLLRINLSNGRKTSRVGGLQRAIGLLMTGDGRFAYVSLQDPGGHRVERIELSTGTREVVASGLTNPFFMTWSDPGESAILLAERDPANRVAQIDLTRSTPQLKRIASRLPPRPSSVAMVTSSRLLVCSDSVISDLDFVADLFHAAGPLLLGVGHVPRDRITQSGLGTVRGYADTTGDPGYFFQVKDAPFGGTLSLMFNHARAYGEGARYYRIWVDLGEPKQTWHDYRWSTTAKRFVLQTISPLAGGYYRVRRPGELWYNHWLAYRLRTGGLSDGLHRIRVRTYRLRDTSTQVSTDAFWIRIDNHRPTASIDQIIHYLHPTGAEVVGTCAIVNKPKDAFRFRITAFDPEGHLKSYHLRALWGDNKSKSVTSRTYVPTANKKWFGLPGSLVPSTAWSAAVPGDPTSTKCAHTFYLWVWDRVINGYRHIHRTRYHKSITIMLP